MKKEVLLSLLMTTPVAFPALADIDLTHLTAQPSNPAGTTNKWYADGATKDGDVTWGGPNFVSCSKSVTQLRRTFENLPKGAYKLNIVGDNLKFTVQIGNGTPQESTAVRVGEEMEAGFRVETESANVTITVTSTLTADEIKDLTTVIVVKSIDFSLNYTFTDEFVKNLNTTAESITDSDDAPFVTELNPDVVNNDLRAKVAALQARQKQYLNDIANIEAAQKAYKDADKNYVDAVAVYRRAVAAEKEAADIRQKAEAARQEALTLKNDHLSAYNAAKKASTKEEKAAAAKEYARFLMNKGVDGVTLESTWDELIGTDDKPGLGAAANNAANQNYSAAKTAYTNANRDWTTKSFAMIQAQSTMESAKPALEAKADKLVLENGEWVKESKNAKETLFELYKKYKFFNETQTIDAGIAALVKDTEANNKLVKDANDAKDAADQNRDNFKTLVEKQQTLVDWIENGRVSDGRDPLLKFLNQQIVNAGNDKDKKAAAEALYKRGETLIANVKDYLKTLNTANEAGDLAGTIKTDGTGEGKVAKYCKTYNELANEYDLIFAAGGSVSDDVDAFNAFKKDGTKNANYKNYLAIVELYKKISGEFRAFEPEFANAMTERFSKALEAEYNRIIGLVNYTEGKEVSLHKVEGAAPVYVQDSNGEYMKNDKGVFVKIPADQTVAAADRYAISTEKGNIASNTANELKVAADAKNVKNTLVKIQTEANAWRTAEKNAKTEIQGIINNLTAAFNATSSLPVPSNFQNDTYKAKKAAAQGVIDELKSALSKAYGNPDNKKDLQTVLPGLKTTNGITKGAGDDAKWTSTAQDEYQGLFKDNSGNPTDLAVVADVSKKISDMKNAINSINHEALNTYVLGVLNDYQTRLSKLTDTNDSKFINLKKEVEDEYKLIMGDGSNIGVAKAFENAYVINDVNSLSNYIDTANFVEGAFLWKDNVNHSKGTTAFTRKAYSDKMKFKHATHTSNKDKSYADYANGLKAEADKFIAAAGSDLRTMMTDMENFGKQPKVKDFKKEVGELRATFAEDLAQANYNKAEEALKAITDILDDAKFEFLYVTADKATYADTEKSKLAAIKNAKNNAQGTLGDKKVNSEAGCNAIYAEANKFINETVKALHDRIADDIDNYQAYLDLTAELGKVSGVVENARNTNTTLNTVNSAAWKHYDNIFGQKAVAEDKVAGTPAKAATGFEAQIAAAAKANWDAAKQKDKSKNALSLKSSLSQSIATLKATADGFGDQMQKNYEFKNKAVQEVNAVQSTVNTIQKIISEKPNASFNPWSARIDAVNDGILKALGAVGASYDSGKANPDYAAHHGVIEGLKADAEKILSELRSDYDNLAAEHNNAYFAEKWTNGALQDINEAYAFALRTARSYANLNNEAYKKYLADNDSGTEKQLASVETVSGKETAINNIQKTANDYLSKLTASDGKVTAIKESDFKTSVLDKADEIINELNGFVTKSNTFANAKAKVYFGTHSDQTGVATTGIKGDADNIQYKNSAYARIVIGNVEKIVFDADPAVGTSKIEVKILDQLVKANADLIAQAWADYQAAEKANTLGTSMSEIANTLAKVKAFTEADYKNVAKQYADAYVKAMDTNVSDWLSHVKKLGDKDPKRVAFMGIYENTDKNPNANAYTEKKKVPSTFNITVSATGIVTGNVTAWQNALDKVYKSGDITAPGLYEAYKPIYEDWAGQAQMDAYNANFKADVQDYFDALKNFTNGIAAPNSSYKNAEDAVKAIRAEIDAKGSILSAKGAIDGMIEDFQNNLHKDYASVADKEIVVLGDKYDEVYVLYNEAVSAGVEGLASIKAEIDALRGQILGSTPGGISKKVDAAKATDGNPERIAAIKALQPDMVTVENELCKLENKLNDLINGTSDATVKAAVKEITDYYDANVKGSIEKAVKAYDALDDVIKNMSIDLSKKENKSYKDFKDALDAYIAADYAGNVEKLLDPVKNASGTINPNVIMQKENYILRLGEIKAALDASDITKKMEKEQSYITKSNEVMGKLQKKYEDKSKTLADAKTFVEGKEYFKYAQFGYAPASDGKKYTKDELVKIQTEYYQSVIEQAEKVMAAEAEKLQAVNSNALYHDRLTDNNKDLFYASEYKAEEKKAPARAAQRPNPTNVFEAVGETEGLNKLIDTRLYSNLYIDEFVGSQFAFDEEIPMVDAALAHHFLLDGAKDELRATYAEIANDRKDISIELPKNGTDAEKKEYQANLEKLIADMDGVITRMRELRSKAAEETFKPGDVNTDLSVDIFDVQEIIDWVLNRRTYDDVKAENEKKAKAGDLNNDQEFDITDIVKTARLASKADKEDIYIPAKAADGANTVATSLVSREGGVSRYAVNVNNSVEFVGGQIDLVLPAGMTIVGVEGAERVENHSMFASSDNGRVILMNMDNAAIDGSNGAVIYVDVIGDGNLAVENVVFADRTGASYVLGQENGTSGIEDTVIDNNGGLKQRIYNAAGQMLRGLQRGVNIIRNADGSVSKEYHK